MSHTPQADISSLFKKLPPKDHAASQSLVNKVFAESIYVKWMLDALEKSGCPFPKERVKCEECPMMGAYDWVTKEILICGNHVRTEKDLINVLTHEMVHAFDDCRAKVVIIYYFY